MWLLSFRDPKISGLVCGLIPSSQRTNNKGVPAVCLVVNGNITVFIIPY